MNDIVDIEFIVDEDCAEPKVTIRSKAKTEQVDRIIEAIENAAETQYPSIPAYSDGKLEFISQRDIMRIRTEGRHIVIDTKNKYYIVKQTLAALENELNRDRFIRISQSEIVNIYKVKHFDISVAGTIIIEFNNGVKTYASRRRIKAIKSFLSEREGK